MTGDWTDATLAGVDVAQASNEFERLRKGSLSATTESVTATLAFDGGTMGGVATRFQDAGDYYMCKLWAGKLALGKLQSGRFTLIASVPFNAGTSWHRLSMTASGSHLTCSGDGVTISADDSSFATGALGLIGYDRVAFRSASISH